MGAGKLGNDWGKRKRRGGGNYTLVCAAYLVDGKLQVMDAFSVERIIALPLRFV